MDATASKIAEIMRDLFDEYDGPIERSLTAEQVHQWDSLAHVQLIVMIEAAFGIRFRTGEVHGFDNLGELIDAVDRKRAEKA